MFIDATRFRKQIYPAFMFHRDSKKMLAKKRFPEQQQSNCYAQLRRDLKKVGK